MRQIKFRAWDKKFKQFCGCYANGMRMNFETGQIYVDNLNITENIILMQYTGLNDKNSRRIFEGDIVCNQREKRYWIIEWIDTQSGYFLQDTNKKNPWNIFIHNATEMEIIGNIYENPELLKTEAE